MNSNCGWEGIGDGDGDEDEDEDGVGDGDEDEAAEGTTGAEATGGARAVCSSLDEPGSSTGLSNLAASEAWLDDFILSDTDLAGLDLPEGASDDFGRLVTENGRSFFKFD